LLDPLNADSAFFVDDENMIKNCPSSYEKSTDPGQSADEQGIYAFF